MIVLTVKTLDSQNHTFTVDDDITVEDFKEKIADTVNIPAETQRIIYCGRVLQDDVKLSDYDVNGKVVHLVERPPPGANPPTTRSSSPQPSRRNATGGGGGSGGFRGFESGGNTVYLGSMAFPSNLMESQGIVPPPPTHSLAGSRLNVARRMLRRADAVITLLENPSARPCDIVNPEEQQDEEVTPIIEARVIVPPGNNEHIDEAMVISAVQNSLFDSGALPVGSQVTVDSNTSATTEGNTGSSTPEDTGNANDTTQNERGSSANNGRPLAENASRTSEMADLLTMLNRLQTRFAPFLERYHQFMVEDPVVSSENVRQTQVMLSRVSEVLHFLGHAYHSLSDIIIRVRTPPPRPLLCRPILIQHSAVVQTGIPIQVEVAQFNLSTDRSNTTSSSASTNNTTTTTTATTTAAVTTTTTPSTTSSGNTSNTLPNAHQQPFVNVRGFPLIPAASMRVQSFPIELRTTARPIGVNISQRNTNNNNNNNNNNSGNSDNITSSSSSTTTTTTVTTNAGTTNTTTTTSSSSENSGFQLPNFNNSSVEFFMEVTPEGTLNGPPPEFLQSLVQMAGQIMNRVTTTTAAGTTTTDTATSSTTSVAGDSSQTTGQNSQARGNTQTHPTTSTHTRSTSRPHVHLAQQAMQGGFDPFLPCNSHHITHRRRQHPQQHQQQQQQQQQQPQQHVFNLRDGLQAIRNFMSNTTSAGGATRRTTTTNTTAQEQRRNDTSEGSENNRQDGNVPNVQNRMDEIYSAVRNAFRQRGPNEPRRVRIVDNIILSTGQASNENRDNTTQNTRASFAAGLPPNLQNVFTSLPNMLQGPTIAEILQQLPPDDSTIRPGESMITDLIMLLSRNLTLYDMITLNSGNVEPLNRISNDIQQFFMTRVLDGSTSQEAVNRGVDRLINEMQPFFQNFGRLRVRDDIDIVRSVEQLFRRRLPDIITTAVNLNSENMRDLVNHCLNLAKLTCRLTLHASANGLQGVEETFQQIITSYMQGIPAELQNWTLMTSCTNLRHFMLNLGSADVESYIIRNSDMPSEPDTQQNETRSETVPTPPPPPTTTTAAATTVEPMELDMEVEISEPVASPEEELEDPEPLPNVVIGSEPWHNQVPEDWVPIITRDVQRQRRQNPQGPFSDAYLSGMPTKRRKIVNSTKPQGSLPQVISESVRRAITTTGLASVAPMEVVAQAAGNCVDVQAAYRNLLRTTVQTALRDNEDFTPERFPNAATYFKTP